MRVSLCKEFVGAWPGCGETRMEEGRGGGRKGDRRRKEREIEGG